MRSRFARMGVLLAVLSVLLTGIAGAELFQNGNLILHVDGSFKPKRLPKKELAPIQLQIENDIYTDDGTVPPILDTLVLDFDRNGTLDTKGLPRCDPRKLQNTLTATALRKCRDALVGRGEARAVIDFPDQDPFVASGPLLAFNGVPEGKNPVVVFHVFAHVPAPTTFVVPAVISDAPGARWGKRVTVHVPPISGGNGALTHFDIKVKRTWTHRGRKHSYLLARCPVGSLLARGRYSFLDGSRAFGSVVRICKQRHE